MNPGTRIRSELVANVWDDFWICTSAPWQAARLRRCSTTSCTSLGQARACGPAGDGRRRARRRSGDSSAAGHRVPTASRQRSRQADLATIQTPGAFVSGLGHRPLTAAARVRIPYAPLLPTAALLRTALALAGCGGGSNSSGSKAPPTTADGRSASRTATSPYASFSRLPGLYLSPLFEALQHFHK